MRRYLFKKIPASQNFLQFPYFLFHNNLSFFLSPTPYPLFFHSKHASPPNYRDTLRLDVVLNKI